MLEKKIAALKNMSKEELVGEFEKIVLYNTQHLEACLGKCGATLFNAAIKIATNNKNKEGKHYAECYEIVKAYIKEHADFAKELQAYMQQQYR